MLFGIDFTFLWTAVDLLIIYFFVNKFLFKRLGASMEKRSADIKADIEKGEALKLEGEQFRRQHEDVLAESYDKRKEIIEDAKKKASIEYENILKEAKKDAERIKMAAREEIEREREQMYKDLKQDIASLVISAASKVVEANLDSTKNRDLVESFLSKEGAA